MAVYAGLVLFPEFCHFSGALFICLYIKYISFKTEFLKRLSHLIKKHKMSFVLGINFLFYQSHLALIFFQIIKSWRHMM